MAQLLSFDPSGAYIPENGLSTSEVARLESVLHILRDEVCDGDVGRIEPQPPMPAQQQSWEAGFFRLPELLLQDYQRLRHESELGRILAITKSLMAEVDRVVVLGAGCDYLGVRALLDACCQPYFNELSRGERGSRPRIYFEGNGLDSDALQGLLHLLAAQRGQRATTVENSWSIVAISNSQANIATLIAVQQFVTALETSCGGNADLVKRRLIHIVGSGIEPLLQPRVNESSNAFTVPANVSHSFSILSAVGLVPAALMGINVMKLLEGAAYMNAHFRDTPASENVVLQFAAINHLLAVKGVATVRVTNVWSKALKSAVAWYDQLLVTNLGASLRGATSLLINGSRDCQSRLRQLLDGRRDKIVNNIIVEGNRFDDLPPVELNAGGDELRADLSDRLADEICNLQRALLDASRPATNLYLPRVDEYYLGQYFQMMLLATVIEGKLLGMHPCA